MNDTNTPVHVCITCNLCCDGTLFSRVGVTSAEQELLKEKGSFYTKTNGEIRMQLGCQYLDSAGTCQCYEERPKLCRTYSCDLLRSVEAGITSMENAIAITEEAKMLRDKSIGASQMAILAGGGTTEDAKDVDALIERVEDQLKISAPIPAPAVALAKYRYRCYVHWIRLYIRSNHPN